MVSWRQIHRFLRMKYEFYPECSTVPDRLVSSHARYQWRAQGKRLIRMGLALTIQWLLEKKRKIDRVLTRRLRDFRFTVMDCLDCHEQLHGVPQRDIDYYTQGPTTL